MKALQFKAPGAVALLDVAAPVATPTEVLLKVRLVGLCGTDLNSYRGRNPLLSFPRIPGHEVSASVAETSPDGKWIAGTDVTVLPYISCGMCVSCNRGRPHACQLSQTLGVHRDGAMVEYLSVPSTKLFTGRLGLKELCLVESLTIGTHAVSRGRVTAEDSVVVFGCGGVGLGAVAFSGFRGATTIAIDMDDAKLALAARCGATHTINTRHGDLSRQLSELTAGRGPDVIIEAVGSPQTFRAAVEEVAFTGRVVYIGYAREQVSYETRLFVQKELDILGARNAQPQDFRDVISMLETGTFPVDEIISSIVPLEQAGQVLQEWSEDPARFQKILIQVS